MPQIDLALAILMVALAVVPTTRLSAILTVWLARKLGVKAQDIERYDDATGDGGEGG